MMDTAAHYTLGQKLLPPRGNFKQKCDQIQLSEERRKTLN